MKGNHCRIWGWRENWFLNDTDNDTTEIENPKQGDWKGVENHNSPFDPFLLAERHCAAAAFDTTRPKEDQLNEWRMDTTSLFYEWINGYVALLQEKLARELSSSHASNNKT